MQFYKSCCFPQHQLFLAALTQCIFRNSILARRCYCNYPAKWKERHQRYQWVEPKERSWCQPISQDFYPSDCVPWLCVPLAHIERAVWESCSVKFIMISARGKRDNKEPPFQQPEKAGVDTAQRSSSKPVHWIPAKTASGSAASPAWMWPLHFNTGAEQN